MSSTVDDLTPIGGLHGLSRDRRLDAAKQVEEWFSACELELGKYLVQILRDRGLAEDLLQETFLHAYRARHSVEDVRNPRAWLFGIARHRALEALRRRRRLTHAVSRLALRRESEAASADADVLAALELLEQQLSPEDRALVLLKYLYGFDANELAEMTERSPAAVRQRLSRARAKLLEARYIKERM